MPPTRLIKLRTRAAKPLRLAFSTSSTKNDGLADDMSGLTYNKFQLGAAININPYINIKRGFIFMAAALEILRVSNHV